MKMAFHYPDRDGEGGREVGREKERREREEVRKQFWAEGSCEQSPEAWSPLAFVRDIS